MTVDDFAVIDGEITYDYDADVQAQLSATIADATGELVPKDFADALAPFGSELHVSMSASVSGIEVIEPLSIGWFRIQEPESTVRWRYGSNGLWRSGGAQISVTALDRMSILSDANFVTVNQPGSTATVLSEIRRLADNMVPMGDIDPGLTDKSVPSSVVYQESRVQALTDLVQVIGGHLWFDDNGALTVSIPTQYGASPVWTFTCGPTGDILEYSVKMTRDGVVNAVVAQGETETDHAQIQGVAYDTDPKSPTRWGGPFGQVPITFASPLMTTAAMCQAGAQTRLNNYRRGREREYTVSTVPNFLLQLDDPVQAILPDRIVPGRIVKMTLPLTPGPMSLTIRTLDSSIVYLG